MNPNTERNKQVKKNLSKIFGSKNIQVQGGKGTSYGWCHITIKTVDPCPYRQNENTCEGYCGAVCQGNDKPISGGWCHTVRQEKWSALQAQAEKALGSIEFGHFYADDGYDTKLNSMIIAIDWI